MKRLIFLSLILSVLLFSGAYAQSDLNNSLEGWNGYYVLYKISGYPEYNQLLDRYDFYDLDDSYRGSLCYNPLIGDWEYFSL